MYGGHGEIYTPAGIRACTHAPISVLRLSARQMQLGDCGDDAEQETPGPGPDEVRNCCERG